MATRPAWTYSDNKVKKENFDFKWNPGLAPSQKKKNVMALHDSINNKTLEVSTKSDSELGQSFSPFNLKLRGSPMETVYHSSKKYEKDGPFPDLLIHKPLVAKRDQRHLMSGDQVGFVFDDMEFPMEPRSYFFNYLYYLAIKESMEKEDLDKLFDYNYFTDIEFNPNKGVSNQARAVTLIKALIDEYGELPDLTRDEFYAFQDKVLDEEL